MKRLLPASPPAASTRKEIEEAEASFRCCAPESPESMAFVSKVFAEDVGAQARERRFIGFARVFAGTLRVGDKVLVLGPRYEYGAGGADLGAAEEGGGDSEAGLLPHASQTTVTSLHLMMGRDLLDVSTVPAGCICGIGGLGQHVLKYATISSR